MVWGVAEEVLGVLKWCNFGRRGVSLMWFGVFLKWFGAIYDTIWILHR